MISNETVVPFEWLKKAKTEEEKQEITNLLTNNQRFVSLLLSILKERYETLELQNHKKESYQDPNNFATMAYDNGKAATYLEVANLFNFKTKEGHIVSS